MIGAVRWSLPEMYRPALGLGQLIIAPLASRCTAVLPSPWPVGSPKDRKWRLPEAHVGGQLLLVLPLSGPSPRSSVIGCPTSSPDKLISRFGSDRHGRCWRDLIKLPGNTLEKPNRVFCRDPYA